MAQEQQIIIDKNSLPTSLRSKDIQILWTEKLRKQSMFSARTTSTEYLDRIKELLNDYLKGYGKTDDGEDISQGHSRTRMLMREKLNELGMIERDAEGAIEERITNLASSMRLNLIVKTQTSLAKAQAQKATSEDPIQKILRPCFELVRNNPVKKERNWIQRWNQAANAVNWEGVATNTSRFIAKTDSPIWSELGHGHSDSLGTDTPPFAFNSEMGWRTVTKREMDNMGLEFGNV